MPLTLGFDTSLGHISAALVQDGTVLAKLHEEMAKGQAEHLLPMMEQMLAGADCSWQNLEKIGVGVGPGNFTGIRIAVSAAKGLALARSIPVVGVSVLEALAHGSAGAVRAVIPAPRDSIYVQDFQDGVAQAAPEHIESSHASHATAAQIIGPVAAIGRPDEDVNTAAYSPGEAIALIAETKEADGPPAPLYLRAADAAPSRIPAPNIIQQ